MATLTLNKIPDSLYNQLKETAARFHRRSINSEILYCVERTLNPHEINVAEHLAMAKSCESQDCKLFVN